MFSFASRSRKRIRHIRRQENLLIIFLRGRKSHPFRKKKRKTTKGIKNKLPLSGNAAVCFQKRETPRQKLHYRQRIRETTIRRRITNF